MSMPKLFQLVGTTHWRKIIILHIAHTHAGLENVAEEIARSIDLSSYPGGTKSHIEVVKLKKKTTVRIRVLNYDDIAKVCTDISRIICLIGISRGIYIESPTLEKYCLETAGHIVRDINIQPRIAHQITSRCTGIDGLIQKIESRYCGIREE